MNKQILITVLVAVMVGAGAFYGGMKYQQSKLPAFGGLALARNGGANRADLAGRGGGGTAGQVLSVDSGKSLTVKLANGSTRVVYLSVNTKYYQDQMATANDVTTGKQVQVEGTPNTSDGSVTATTVRLTNQ